MSSSHLMPTFMLTASGREYNLTGAAAYIDNRPAIADIAHHLAQINRYTGAARRPYSVAEHSLLVERIGAARGASPITRLALLMHDAHEAYTSDLSSPAKAAIGTPWHAFESPHALNVRLAFGLRTVCASMRTEIHRCDLIALATERRDLLNFDPAVNSSWPVIDSPGQEVAPSLEERIPDEEAALSWRAMRDAFLNRFLHLRTLVEMSQAAAQ